MRFHEWLLPEAALLSLPVRLRLLLLLVIQIVLVLIDPLLHEL